MLILLYVTIAVGGHEIVAFYQAFLRNAND